MQRLHSLRIAVTQAPFFGHSLPCTQLCKAWCLLHTRLAILAIVFSASDCCHAIYSGLFWFRWDCNLSSGGKNFCQLLTTPGHGKPQEASVARHVTAPSSNIRMSPQLTEDGIQVQKHWLPSGYSIATIAACFNKICYWFTSSEASYDQQQHHVIS